MVLGLSKPIISIPNAATTKKKIMESFEWFEQDFGWKVYLTGKEDTDFNIKYNSKLYMRSRNRPPLPPPAIGLQVVNSKIATKNSLATSAQG